MKSKIVGLLAVGLLGAPVASNAAFIFTNVVLTPSSVSFTINGDMSEYTAPDFFEDQFSIVYTGGLWVGSANQPSNTWTVSPFDNKGIVSSFTGGFALYNGTNAIFLESLNNALSTSQNVTVSWTGDYLDPSATGQIQFVWGTPAGASTLLASFDKWGTAAVPEPGTLALLGLGLLGLGLARRKAA